MTRFTFGEELGSFAFSLNSLTCLFERSRSFYCFVNSCSFPVTVKIILSLNLGSFFWKLHAAALVLSSVKNLSNGSSRAKGVASGGGRGSWGARDPLFVSLFLSKQPTIFRWRKRHNMVNTLCLTQFDPPPSPF